MRATHADRPTAARPARAIPRLLLLASLLGGVGCQADRHGLAPTEPPAAAVLADNGDNPVKYRSVHLVGGGGWDPYDATSPETALKTPVSGDPPEPSYASTVSRNIEGATKQEIKALITETALKDADDNDVSLISISTHGEPNLLYVGRDRLDKRVEFTGAELKTLLDAIKGVKIVIISACFSASLMDAAGELPGANTVVLVSAKDWQKSHGRTPMFGEDQGHAYFIGWVTAGLADNGAGFARADANGNGEVTAQELFDYVAPRTKASADRDGWKQDPQIKAGAGVTTDAVLLRYKKGTLAEHTSEEAAEGEARAQCVTTIRCELGPRSPSFIGILVQATAGLQRIDVLKAVNASVAVPSFVPGTTDLITVTATKVNLALSAQVALRVTDMTGAAIACDPVLVAVSRTTGTPIPTTLTGLPQAERRISITNGSPGLTTLRVEVNGMRWQLAGMADGETRMLDVAPAMKPGSDNTIVLTPLGRPGASAVVLIHD